MCPVVFPTRVGVYPDKHHYESLYHMFSPHARGCVADYPQKAACQAVLLIDVGGIIALHHASHSA